MLRQIKFGYSQDEEERVRDYLSNAGFSGLPSIGAENRSPELRTQEGALAGVVVVYSGHVGIFIDDSHSHPGRDQLVKVLDKYMSEQPHQQLMGKT